MKPTSKDQLRNGHRTAIAVGIGVIGILLAIGVAIEFSGNNDALFKGLIPPSQVAVLRYVFLGLAAGVFFMIRAFRNFILSRPISLPIPEPEGVFSEPIQVLIETSVTTYVLSVLVGLFGLVLHLLTGHRSEFYLFFVLALTLLAIYFPRYGEWEEWIKGVERGVGRTHRSLIRSLIARIWAGTGKVSEYLWVYPVNLEYRLFVGIGLASSLFGLLIFALVLGLRESLLIYTILVALNLPYVLVKKTVEIDRRRGVITKWWQFFLYKNDRVYQLSDFSSVTLNMKGLSRYGTWPLYMVYLVGSASSLKLFDTTSEERAGRYSRELAEFLEFEFVNRTAQWDLI